MTEPTAVDARVRNTFNTYTASIKGLRASCTCGPEQAAAALARKVFGDRPASVELVRRDGQVEIWRMRA